MKSSEEIHWESLTSVNNDSKALKTHGFIDNGKGGNISLCGKITAMDNGIMSMDELKKDGKSRFDKNGCKLCLSVFGKLENER